MFGIWNIRSDTVFKLINCNPYFWTKVHFAIKWLVFCVDLCILHNGNSREAASPWGWVWGAEPPSKNHGVWGAGAPQKECHARSARIQEIASGARKIANAQCFGNN